MVRRTGRKKDNDKKRVKRRFGAPEEMEVERREEVEEEGGELVQAVEHLKRYIIYQPLYHTTFIKVCGRPGCSATSRSRTSRSPYTAHS